MAATSSWPEDSRKGSHWQPWQWRGRGVGSVALPTPQFRTTDLQSLERTNIRVVRPPALAVLQLHPETDMRPRHSCTAPPVPAPPVPTNSSRLGAGAQPHRMGPRPNASGLASPRHLTSMTLFKPMRQWSTFQNEHITLDWEK